MNVFARIAAWFRALIWRSDRMLIRTHRVPDDERDSLQRFKRIQNTERNT